MTSAERQMVRTARRQGATDGEIQTVLEQLRATTEGTAALPRGDAALPGSVSPEDSRTEGDVHEVVRHIVEPPVVAESPEVRATRPASSGAGRGRSPSWQ